MVSIADSLAAIPYVVFAFFCFLLYVMIMKQSNGKKVIGHVYGEFFAKSGQSYGELCKEERGYVYAPKGHEIGCYFVTPDCSYDSWYPPGKGILTKLTRVRVRRSVWLENNPIPRVSVDPSRWIENEKVVEITSYMIDTAANESFQKSALEMQKTFWGEITTIAKFVKNMPYALYASVGALFAAGIAAYFAYMAYMFMASRFP